jgi:ADP-dependent NAD(P)H-hydrate dehydratase / NAD(P)H-hydrate epimerase
MKILTPAEIRTLDTIAVEEYGVSSLSLMQRAAEGIANTVHEIFSKRRLCAPVGIFTGKGNNGGDGFATACVLADRDIASRVFTLYGEKELSKDATHFYRKIKKIKSIQIIDVSTETLLHQATKASTSCSLLVDAILGTGYTGTPTGMVAKAIDHINLLGHTVVAVDVPSGLDATTGKASKAVTADVTVTLGFCKSGFLLGDAMNQVGTLRIVDIGIPDEASSKIPSPFYLLHRDAVGPLLPRRLRISHKGHYGHLLVVGGSMGMSGAIVLCGRAALRAGSGLVTIACPISVQPIVAQSLPEVMTLGLPETNAQSISSEAIHLIKKAVAQGRYDAIVLGPGLSRHKDSQSFVMQVFKQIDIPLLLDADALFALAESKVNLGKAKTKHIILTPHIGEFSKLLGETKNEVQNNLWKYLNDFAQSSKSIVVAKSHITGVSDGKSHFVGTAGNPGMATAGMGDALSGIIGSFLGQGLTPLDAAAAGVYVHSMAGDLASVSKGFYGLIASDVIESIPEVISDLPLRR